jgi:hypothetical protein
MVANRKHMMAVIIVAISCSSNLIVSIKSPAKINYLNDTARSLIQPCAARLAIEKKFAKTS